MVRRRGPISIYYASRRQVRQDARLVDFVAEAFRRQFAERFAAALVKLGVRFAGGDKIAKYYDLSSSVVLSVPPMAPSCMRAKSVRQPPAILATVDPGRRGRDLDAAAAATMTI
jgi:hypothetical protein